MLTNTQNNQLRRNTTQTIQPPLLTVKWGASPPILRTPQQKNIKSTYDWAITPSDDENEIEVLLIEDEYLDTLLTIQALNAVAPFYKMNRINHGDDVLPYLAKAAEERMPDVILLDMGLPGSDGFEILAALASAPALMRSAPIIIITGHSDFEYIQKTYDLPIYGFLTKPVHADTLRDALAKLAEFSAPI